MGLGHVKREQDTHRITAFGRADVGNVGSGVPTGGSADRTQGTGGQGRYPDQGLNATIPGPGKSKSATRGNPLDRLKMESASPLGPGHFREIPPRSEGGSRLTGLLACPDCRTPLEDPAAGVDRDQTAPPSIHCPGCGRRFSRQGTTPILTPLGATRTTVAGTHFFIDEPGRMTRLRRTHPLLARLLSLPNFAAPGVSALPRCRAWFEAHVARGAAGERILNLGSGVDKVYDNPNLVNFDIAPHANAEVVGDGEQLPFRDAVFDGVVLDAVIEHLAHPARVVAEARRVLKPGGHLLANVPFLYPFHAAPHDYRRYTPQGLSVLFEEFEVIEAGSDRRPGRAVLEVMTAYAAGLSDRRGPSYALRWLTAWLWLPLTWLDPWLARKAKADYVTSSSSILVRKPST